MARSYHIDIAQYAADVDRKWVDNLLSQFDIAGVDRRERGVSRRISTAAIYHIVLARQLTQGLRIGVPAAVALAGQLLSGSVRDSSLPPGLSYHFDRSVFEAEVDRRIAEAVESVMPARRGRPPREESD
jgi:hypothetical protein